MSEDILLTNMKASIGEALTELTEELRAFLDDDVEDEERAVQVIAVLKHRVCVLGRERAMRTME